MDIHSQKNMTSRTLLNVSSVIVLFTGLASSIHIYLTARDAPPPLMDYDFENTKKYMRDLELYGGKANVMAVNFMKWFNGLWQGKMLAYTVGCITLLIAVVLLLAAYYISSETENQGAD